MNLNVTIEVWHKGKWYVAKCPELDFISQGKTREEAKNNLLEVIQIQFEEMSQIGALDEYLAESTPADKFLLHRQQTYNDFGKDARFADDEC